MDFPKRTATCHVKGFAIEGTLVEVEERTGAGLYHFPDDAVLGDAWDAWLTPEEALSASEIAALARHHYRGLRG
jgi:hypothetical protein